jgi:hypothetical protein
MVGLRVKKELQEWSRASGTKERDASPVVGPPNRRLRLALRSLPRSTFASAKRFVKKRHHAEKKKNSKIGGISPESSQRLAGDFERIGNA